MHKLYNYLPTKLKQFYLQKLLKMLSRQAWVESSRILFKRGGRAQVLWLRVHNCLIESRECFVTVNICNRSTSLDNNFICVFVCMCVCRIQ